MKPSEIVAFLLPAVREAHKFIYVNEDIYEYKNGVYVEITEDEVFNYVKAARSSFPINEEDITRNVKNEIVAHIKDSSIITKKDYEKRVNKDLVAFENGYIDVKDLLAGNVVLHTFDDGPDAPLFFSKIPHKFNIDTLNKYKEDWSSDLVAEHVLQCTAPTIYNFFQDLQGVAGIKLQISKIGYCLYRSNPYKVFFMELGVPDTGKTTYISLVEKVIGTANVSHKSIQDISNYSFSAYYLFNKLANIHDDLPRRMITDTGMIKQLTGESPISGHRKFKTDIDFVNFAKLIFTANELPGLRQLDDDAFFSRLVLTIYKNKFERSDFGRTLLTKEDEIEGLVLAAVISLRDILQRNVFADNYTEYAEFWRRHINSVYDFVKTYIENTTLAVSQEHKIEKDELYRLYCEFEKEPVGKTKFTQELGKLFGVSANSHIQVGSRQVWAYKGIGYTSHTQSKFEDDYE